ncbi:long-chain fatty acid--CoA ligase [Occultella glacieicola]|uniref:Long-chain fatty acid--CoA ligase n=1 Tax=Occultella glacieicola TaxID=2518684 RepID=A0ABY2E2L8_9MICO|nr:long-chain-fatty-acid--CoA ligase [Occultella glacieicola]TDE88917.1 long-chain fatty acid--CoA ligase [Occultella glacieicola]
MTEPTPPWVRNYQEGVPATIEAPTESLPSMLEDSVRQFGPKVAIEFFGARTTYAELGDQVARAAEGLRRLGVEPGDRVALVLPNCPQYLVAFYAALRLGAVVVSHNPLYTAEELAHQFADHRARVVIAWDSVVPRIASFAADTGVRDLLAVSLIAAMPRLKRLALALPVPAARAGRAALSGPSTGSTGTWGDLLAGTALAVDHPFPDVRDLAVLQYTSGTTGRPKGAMLSHYNLRSNALQGQAWMHGAVPGAETIYGVLPMFHAFGLTLYLTFSVLTGSKLVLFPKFDVDLLLGAVRKSPPTVLCAVPPIYEKVATEGKARGVDLSTIRFAISGAMVLPGHVVELWESVAGGLLVEGYGLTESSPVALGNPFAPSRRNGTIGVPFPSTDMRVVDPDHPDVDVPQGEPGELLLRGPQVFSGYFGDPEATAQTLLDGGWLRTGDIVTVDADHFTTVVDRRKEIIITGGFNVSPSEVEEVLVAHADVAEAAVVGHERADGGEQVVAAVVLVEGAQLDEQALRAFCREHLTPYKVPKRIVAVDEVPRSMLGKVERRKVREELASRWG